MHSSSLKLLLKVRELERMVAEAELGQAVAGLRDYAAQVEDVQQHASGEKLFSGSGIGILQTQIASASLLGMGKLFGHLHGQQEAKKVCALRAVQRAELTQALCSERNRSRVREDERSEGLERDDLIATRTWQEHC